MQCLARGQDPFIIQEMPGIPSECSSLFFRNKAANGDCRKDPRERSRSPIERAVAPTMGLHSSHLYASLPSLSMEQPLALTKNSLDASRPVGISPTLTPVERQQVGLCPIGLAQGWTISGKVGGEGGGAGDGE